MKNPKIQVNLKNYQRRSRINRPEIRSYIEKAWSALKNSRAIGSSNETEITVVFLNDQQMRGYNSKYRKKDYPTDVLSFPAEQDRYLGDILISVERAAAQAQMGLQHELKILLLHGILHLLSYDHETDHGEMERLEARIRKALLK